MEIKFGNRGSLIIKWMPPIRTIGDAMASPNGFNTYYRKISQGKVKKIIILAMKGLSPNTYRGDYIYGRMEGYKYPSWKIPAIKDIRDASRICDKSGETIGVMGLREAKGLVEMVEVKYKLNQKDYF